MQQTYDINTSDEADGDTPAGRTYRPLRYTTTDRDAIRVGVWNQLTTILGTYRFATDQGLDVETLIDPATNDAERSALVANIVLDYPGVVGISVGPVVTVTDGIVTIDLTADTVDGPITLTV